MKRLRTFLICSGLAILYALPIFTLPGLGAFDAFYKIDTIPGESVDDKHKGWIEVLSWSWGASSSATQAGGGTGGTTQKEVNDFRIIHQIDSASPALMLKCFDGSTLPEATLAVADDDGSGTGSTFDYLVVVLTDVIVTSVSSAGSSTSGEQPTEEIAFSYQKIQWSYTPKKSDGTPDTANTKTFGWDLKTNSEF